MCKNELRSRAPCIKHPQVICRLNQAASKASSEGIVRRSHDQALAIQGSQSQECRSVQGLNACGCLENVHSWMLALAVRACRRHLLEASGWQDNRSGDNEGT